MSDTLFTILFVAGSLLIVIGGMVGVLWDSKYRPDEYEHPPVDDCHFRTHRWMRRDDHHE